jgi:hypothetical protein
MRLEWIPEENDEIKAAFRYRGADLLTGFSLSTMTASMRRPPSVCEYAAGKPGKNPSGM